MITCKDCPYWKSSSEEQPYSQKWWGECWANPPISEVTTTSKANYTPVQVTYRPETQSHDFCMIPNQHNPSIFKQEEIKP